MKILSSTTVLKKINNPSLIMTSWTLKLIIFELLNVSSRSVSANEHNVVATMPRCLRIRTCIVSMNDQDLNPSSSILF